MPKYRTVVLDCPWPQQGGGKIKRGADRHYENCKSESAAIRLVQSCPLLGFGARGSDERLSGVRLHLAPKTVNVMWGECTGVANDAHVYSWSPWGNLEANYVLVRSLGFKPITIVPWLKRTVTGKLHPVLGQYFRGLLEPVLFGVRGDGYAVRTASRAIQGFIDAARSEHSRKPDEFYRMVMARSKGPYLELFARERREMQRGRGAQAWMLWGDEAPKGRVAR